MKQIILLFLILSSISALSQGVLIPKKGSDGGLLLTGLKDITVMLEVKQSPYYYVYCGGCTNVNFNNDGKVELNSGFDFNDSRFIKVSGKDSFVINQHRTSYSASYAISVHGKSSDIEFDRVPIRNAGGGLWWKNEHFCDSSLTDWVLSNLSYHDGEIKNVYEHGGYIGATELQNTTRPENCNGIQTYLNPSHMSGIKIYNVKIHKTGKNGMMVNDCRFTPAFIDNLTIDSVGLQGDPAQGQGLAIGGYTRGTVTRVTVKGAKTWGIRGYGADSLRIDSCNVTGSGYENIYVSNNSYPGTNMLKACGNNVNVALGDRVVLVNCGTTPPNPTPTKEIYHNGYFTDSKTGKRVYYQMYTDGTWVFTNARYQPIK